MQKLVKVISGGQTGADRAALKAAKSKGIPTGGCMPRGFLAHDGEHPEFASLYGMHQSGSPEYPPRTEENVRVADATIRFATNFNTRGEKLTEKMIHRHRKHGLSVDLEKNYLRPKDVARWLVENNVRVLNVAGNSEKRSPGIEARVEAFLLEVFSVLPP